jgi:hypothetical protein
MSHRCTIPGTHCARQAPGTAAKRWLKRRLPAYLSPTLPRIPRRIKRSFQCVSKDCEQKT